VLIFAPAGHRAPLGENEFQVTQVVLGQRDQVL
jgi:hypothetical protein